jgi:2-isopropylmalate synthase
VISPEAVGAKKHRLVVGKHSGRNAIRSHLTEMGVSLTDEELQRCYVLVIALADTKKDISDADILRLAREAQGSRDASGVAV